MSSSAWTHATCSRCWNARNPQRPSHREIAGPLARCCYCAAPTCSGIYVRANPSSPELRCGGAASWHEDPQLSLFDGGRQ